MRDEQGGAEIDGPTMKKLVTPHSEDKVRRQAISLQAYAGHESDDEDEDGSPTHLSPSLAPLCVSASAPPSP